MNPQQFQFVSWIGNELQNMVNSNITVFLAEGHAMIYSLATVLLVFYLAIGFVSQTLRNEFIVELIINFMIGFAMLDFYDTPMPWGGVSFHAIFFKEAQWAAALLDVSSVNTLLKMAITMYKNMEVPSIFDILDVFIYLGTCFNLLLIWLLTSGITLIAHIALGFGSLMGPLLIPFFIWPTMQWLFWGYIKFQVTYALYLISSSAIVFLYVNVLTYFMTHIVGGDYTAGHMSAVLIPFAVLNGCFLIAFWQCHGWAREIAAGAGGMGAHVSSVASSLAGSILA